MIHELKLRREFFNYVRFGIKSLKYARTTGVSMSATRLY